MIVWLDAQLPPALARWFRDSARINVQPIRDLRPRPVRDVDIFMAAGHAGCVVITKDKDVSDIVTKRGPPPQIVRLTCGNLTNAALIIYFETYWPDIETRLSAGEPLVVM